MPRTRRRLDRQFRLETLENREMLSIAEGPIQYPGNGHYYYLLTPSTWTDAEAEAVELGGHLATIRNLAENSWVYEQFALTGVQHGLWIGLNDIAVEGRYEWVSGEPVQFLNWAGGQPDNWPDRGPEDNVEIIATLGGQAGQWNDFSNRAYSVEGFPMQGVVEVDRLPTDLVATELSWNTAQGGVDFSYKVAGADLTQDTTAALYWASGTTFDTILGDPIYDTPIEHPADQCGRFYVSDAELGEPPVGATHLLLAVDPKGLVEETGEANNVASLGLPDLMGSAFHYTVLEDRTRVGGLRVADGPLPFNAHFDLNAVVANLGAGDAGPFTVSFYASTDARITTSDVPIARATIGSLAGGSSAPIHFDGLQLPQHLPWTGTIYLGMILDADATMPQVEARRDNNANEGDTIDRVIAQLYDPLPPVFIMASGFRTERQAALHLFRSGFLPQVPGTGRGWTKLLPGGLRIVSRRDGIRRSGLAYRQDAGIYFDAATRTYFIEVQGTPTFGEPSPETAILHGPAWFAYVFDWHRRF